VFHFYYILISIELDQQFHISLSQSTAFTSFQPRNTQRFSIERYYVSKRQDFEIDLQLRGRGFGKHQAKMFPTRALFGRSVWKGEFF
jgi:hypothetical protein